LELFPPSVSLPCKKVAVALHNSFQKIKDELKHELKDIQGGTTALISFFKGNDLYVANVGDTRAVLGKRDGKVSVNRSLY
jgi:serine/threonine protein phosphatase PrpC